MEKQTRETCQKELAEGVKSVLEADFDGPDLGTKKDALFGEVSSYQHPLPEAVQSIFYSKLVKRQDFP